MPSALGREIKDDEITQDVREKRKKDKRKKGKKKRKTMSKLLGRKWRKIKR